MESSNFTNQFAKLSFDENSADDFSCPICYETYMSVVLQCCNGHSVCDCCIKSLKECPQCRQPYNGAPIRNRALEGVLDQLMFNCPHKSKGCIQRLRRAELGGHKEACEYRHALPLPDRILVNGVTGNQLQFSNDASGGFSGIFEHSENNRGAPVNSLWSNPNSRFLAPRAALRYDLARRGWLEEGNVSSSRDISARASASRQHNEWDNRTTIEFCERVEEILSITPPGLSHKMISVVLDSLKKEIEVNGSEVQYLRNDLKQLLKRQGVEF